MSYTYTYTLRIYCAFMLREHVKNGILADASAKGGRGPQCKFFLKIENKCLECSDKKENAKIVCEFFARVSIKKFEIFINIFFL